MPDAPPGSRKLDARGRGSRIVHGVLYALFLLTVVEATSYVGGRWLAAKGVLYRPSFGDYRRYLAERDPVLGWPKLSEATSGERDATGSRIIPAFPDPAASPPRVSVYGDSFTWGDEVGPSEAWSNLLSKRLGARVNNFGVGGYGSDQAFLRYLHNEQDRAPIVILCHLSEDILRNLNQFRDALLGGGGGLGFKPRFVLSPGGSLELVPLPQPPVERYEDFVERPEHYLEHETFAPGGPYGPVRLRFPYVLSLLRALGHFHVQAELRSRVWYAPFYDPDHPAHGVELTERLFERFVEVAHERGQRPLIVLMPTGKDLAWARGHGSWPYGPLTRAARRRGLPVLDLGPRLLERIGEHELERYFVHGRLDQHFNALGYRLVADALYEHLAGAADPAWTAGVPTGRAAVGALTQAVRH